MQPPLEQSNRLRFSRSIALYFWQSAPKNIVARRILRAFLLKFIYLLNGISFLVILSINRMSMRLLFVMNPTSGRNSPEDAIVLIQQQVKERQHHYAVFYTTGEDDDKKLKEKIQSYQPDRIAACGGDGTVQMVARNLIGVDIPMGILPLGSANGLATALGIPKNIEDAAFLFFESDHIVPLDLIRINDEYICTHLADLGTNALLVKSYEEAGDKGMLGYAKHLISSIQQSDLMRCQIKTSAGVFQKEGYMLMIANAHKYGTGVQISEGSVSDGKFEICNVQKIDLESAIKVGLTAINIFVDKDMFSDVISCREAEISITPKAHLQIDGEYIGEVDHLNVKIISSALRVIINDDVEK
jgi:diacylglycerol kinase (ATP)